MTIDDLASLHGLSVDDVLLYESSGLLSPVRIYQGAFYGDEHRLRIEMILKGEEPGFSLQEIKAALTHLGRSN